MAKLTDYMQVKSQEIVADLLSRSQCSQVTDRPVVGHSLHPTSLESTPVIPTAWTGK